MNYSAMGVLEKRENKEVIMTRRAGKNIKNKRGEIRNESEKGKKWSTGYRF